ncbi:MAG: phosphoribosyl-AMP cyclohydrolase [Methanobacteriaceae archaeon]
MELNFKHNINGEQLIIAVAQDYESSQVLMVAFMNKLAFQKSLETKVAHYWSTSRNKLWLKGESSNNTQEIKEVFVDCDMDCIVLKVKQNGAACHEGYYSCFFREINTDNQSNIDPTNLKEDDIKVIAERLFNPDDVYGA